MAQPFVISMKFVGDASSAVDAAARTVASIDQVNATVAKANSRSGPQAQIDQLLGLSGGSAALKQTDADIAAYGTSLDALRAQFNPLFAAEQAHTEQLAAMDAAYKVGAIDAEELAAAVATEAASYEATIAAIDASTLAHTRLSGEAQAAEHAARGFIEQIALGVSPTQALTAQMSHLSYAASGEGGLVGAFKGIGGALAPLLTGPNLIAVGVIGLTVAVSSLWDAFGPKAQSAADALKEQRDQVAQLVSGYAAASSAADEYYTSQAQRPASAVLSDLQKQFEDAQAAYKQFRDYANLEAAPGVDDFSFMTDSMKKLIVQFNAGKLSAGDLETKLTELKNSDLGPLGFAIRPFIDSLADAAKKAGNLQDAIIGIDHISAGVDVSQSVQYALAQKFGGINSADQYQVDLAAITALSPAAQADIARRREELQLRDQNLSAGRMQQEIDQAGELAYASAAHAVSEADRMRLQSANDNIAASQLSLTLVGQGIAAASQLQFVQQNLQSAQDEAARTGSSVSAAYVAQVKALGAAYGELQQQIALAQLKDNLSFDQAQLGRSPNEQDVASQLRSVYGDDYEKQMDGATAGQIRLNQAIAAGQQQAQLFSQSVETGFEGVIDGSESAADAVNQLWKALVDAVIQAQLLGTGPLANLFGTSGSANTGGPLGGFLSSIVGGLANIGHNASGTDNWKGGLTAVNEQGGEILNLPNGTQVIPHDVSMQMAANANAGSGAQTTFAPNTTINITGSGVTMAQVSAALDQRDDVWSESFADMVQHSVLHPRRRGRM